MQGAVFSFYTINDNLQKKKKLKTTKNLFILKCSHQRGLCPCYKDINFVT